MGTTLAVEGGKPLRVPVTGDAARELVDKARNGDKSAMPAVREWLRNEGGYLVDPFGSPAARAQEKAVETFSSCVVTRAAADEKLARLSRELAGENPTPLERLLADRVAFSWFTLYRLETRLANDAGQQYTYLNYLDQRIGHAHRRFLSAARSLAVVKRLGVSSVLSVTESVGRSVTVTSEGGDA